jgi:hypothetical protein
MQLDQYLAASKLDPKKQELADYVRERISRDAFDRLLKFLIEGTPYVEHVDGERNSIQVWALERGVDLGNF